VRGANGGLNGGLIIWTVQNQVGQTVELWSTPELAHTAARRLAEDNLAAYQQNPMLNGVRFTLREIPYCGGWVIQRSGRDDEPWKVRRREIWGLSAVDRLAALARPP